MQHILLHIIKEAKSHMDIVSHFQKDNSSRWYNLIHDHCRINIDPTRSIGISSTGKVIIIIKHKLQNTQKSECKEEEIVENSIHVSYLSSNMSIDDYIDYIKLISFFHVIVSDGKNIFQIETENIDFHITPLVSGLYLYAYNEEDYFDGWLLKLINLNRKYDDSLKQIYVRVGYSRQFNLETNISNRSTIMVMFLRDKKHTINELNMKICENYTYSFDKNNKRVIYEKSNEKLDSFPEIFKNWDNYGKIIKEFKLRLTFLPNPTSIKTRGLENKNKIRYCYSAYNFYSKDIRLDVEEEYSLKYNEENLNKDTINRLIGDKWKNEFYDIRHKYEMFAILDKIRYMKESKKVLIHPYDIIDQEKDNFIKEEIISKICHFKLIFSNNNNKPLTDDAKFIIYYNININKYILKNPLLTIDEISEKIYHDFMLLGDLELDEIIEKSNKNISYELIDKDATKFLPSRMTYLIESEKDSNEENELQINQKIENQPIKRKNNEENDEIRNKRLKQLEEVNANVNEVHNALEEVKL